MSESPIFFLPTVLVRCGDEASRRRIEDFLRREVFAECVVAVATAGSVEESAAATLSLTGDVARQDAAACDYALPTSCSDAELRTAVRLLAKVAALRDSLFAVRRNESVLQQLAATDPLTGLANRRAWDDELLRLGRAAQTRNESLVVAILDLDLFKQVNETHGHPVGDAVLKATADGVRHAVRRGDLAARLGGDEFGLLLPGLSVEAVAAVVERIRQAAVAAVSAAGLPAVTCSLGFAAEQGRALDVERLYASAAAALQTAKRAGRNRSATQ